MEGTPHHEKQTSERIDLLAEAALDTGLKAAIPPEGSAAWRRLYALCAKYSEAVHKDLTGKYGGGMILQKERREAHQELCKMLFGTGYEETPAREKEIAANFSHLVAGREQYMK